MIEFSGVYSGKRVLVTGNTGFKGSWLTSWLLAMGAEVHGLSNGKVTEPSMYDEAGLEGKLTQHWLDIRDREAMTEIFKKVNPEIVFHLAAQAIVSKSYDDPVDTLSTNVMGSSHVLEALRGLEHLCVCVYITSDKCYENVEWIWGYRETDRLGGKDVYSASKGAAELVFHAFYHSFIKEQHSLRIATARAGNVIGGGDWAANRIVPDCFKAWSNGETVTLRSPKSTRPWQHVLEPLSGYLRLGQALLESEGLKGESYNFGPFSHETQPVVELVRDLEVPMMGESKPERIEVIEQNKFHEAGLLKLNCDKALTDLAWRPVWNYDETVKLTGEWYARYQRGEKAESITMNQIAQYVSCAAERKICWVDS